ncbi:unnamed protein product [Gemmataceae bacterium]|nr:unnamed protein product [Gemmataceae bacterium]VTT96860.1 unnamed protein product [Gemmataceae bacterium]
MTHDPAAGNPSVTWPVFMNTHPGPCVFVFDVIPCRNAMSSANFATSGTSVESIFPHSPAALNAHGGRIKLPFFPWKLTRFSSPGSGLPSSFSSVGLWSHRSMCDAAPGQKIWRTRFAFAGWCVWFLPGCHAPPSAPASRARSDMSPTPANPVGIWARNPRRSNRGGAFTGRLLAW